MDQFPEFERRWTRENMRNLNALAATVEAMTQAGTGATAGEGLPEGTPHFERAIARITGVSTPVFGHLYTYTYKILAVSSQPIGYAPMFVDQKDNFWTGVAGPGNIYQAFERSNNPAVPVDGSAIVELYIGPTGSWLFDWTETTVYAQLYAEGSPGFYAWHEEYPTAGGTFGQSLRSGTSVANFAHEINGIQGLTANGPINAILFRSHCSGYPVVQVLMLVPGDNLLTQEIQTISISNAIGGTFTLAYDNGDPTDSAYVQNFTSTYPLAFNCADSDVETALRGVGASGVRVAGAGTLADPFMVTFADTVPRLLMGADSSNLQSDQEWAFIGSAVAESSLAVAEWTTTEILVISPVSKIEFDIGADSSQGLVSDIGGGIARYRPWSLTVEDLVPTTEDFTTTLQFGTNFYISEPSANKTRVDFGLTVDDLIVNTVTKVQHVTFQAGFTVTVNATTGHAFVAFSGSAYSLTVEDYDGTTIVGGSAHTVVVVSGTVVLEAKNPLYITTPGGTTAVINLAKATPNQPGFMDDEDQDFGGVKRFFPANPAALILDRGFIQLDGNLFDPIGMVYTDQAMIRMAATSGPGTPTLLFGDMIYTGTPASGANDGASTMMLRAGTDTSGTNADLSTGAFLKLSSGDVSATPLINPFTGGARKTGSLISSVPYCLDSSTEGWDGGGTGATWSPQVGMSSYVDEGNTNHINCLGNTFQFKGGIFVGGGWTDPACGTCEIKLLGSQTAVPHQIDWISVTSEQIPYNITSAITFWNGTNLGNYGTGVSVAGGPTYTWNGTSGCTSVNAALDFLAFSVQGTEGDIYDILHPSGGGGSIPNSALMLPPVNANVAADVTTTSNTMANVTGLSWSIGAGEVWSVEFNLYCTGSLTGMQFQLTGPASPTFVRVFTQGDTTGVGSVSTDSQTAFGSPTQSYVSTSFSGYVRVMATIENGANAGTVQLQFASTTNTQTNKVLRGSYMTGRRIS
jgi:hypothetical protein